MPTTIIDAYYSDDFKRSSCRAMIAAIRQALSDEHSAVNAYQAMVDSDILSERDAKVIVHVRDEEMDHEHELVQLINKLQRLCVPDMGKHKTKVK